MPGFHGQKLKAQLPTTQAKNGPISMRPNLSSLLRINPILGCVNYVRFRELKVCALGQKVLPPSTSPTSHLSHRASRGHLMQRRRTIFAIATFCRAPSVPGSKPTRLIMAIIRLAEVAVMFDRSHTTRATATPAMIMATLICVGSMVTFSLSHASRAQ